MTTLLRVCVVFFVVAFAESAAFACDSYDQVGGVPSSTFGRGLVTEAGFDNDGGVLFFDKFTIGNSTQTCVYMLTSQNVGPHQAVMDAQLFNMVGKFLSIRYTQQFGWEVRVAPSSSTLASKNSL